MLKIDRHVVIQVLGGLMNKPEYLCDTDKYRLEISDFPNALDKFIFSAINNLYNDGEGATKIRAIDVLNYLKDNVNAKTLIEKENGEIFLQDCETTGEPENFNYYYQKLKKLNFLKDIESTGHNIDKFYCEDIFNPDYTKINENFERMSVNDILNELKLEVNYYENKFIFNTVVEESKASDHIDELIEELKEKPEVGCRLQGDIFNSVCRGGRKGKLYLRSAASGLGKALPNYTRIPTPDGWKTVGEINVGDYLFDRMGNPTKVLAVYPQAEKKRVYKVYFKSGRIAECCEDHLWSYYKNKSENKNELVTSTLKEIINQSLNLRDVFGNYLYSIPLCGPVQYKTKEFKIEPYKMGKFLSSTLIDYKEGNDIAKEFPLLAQSGNKYKSIPEDYLYSDVIQRFELLSGLLNSSSIDKKGEIVFTTISKALRTDVIELCESLGMIATFKKKKNKVIGEYYEVKIKTSKKNIMKLFKLNHNGAILNDKEIENVDRDDIVKIKATQFYSNMTCFYVDNDEHLFLTENFCVTHNTRSMVGDACNIAYPIRFDRKKNKWVSTGSAEKVLYVMTEQDTEEIKTMILSYLTGYNEEIFLYGTYGEEEMPRIKQAIEIMKRYKDNMLLARIPDPSASVVKNLFRRYNIQYGVENFFYDYIFSSPAMLEEYRDLKLREDVCLRLFTTALKNLAIELNAFVLTSTQISNDRDDGGGFKDYHQIQGQLWACIYLYLLSKESNIFG